MFETFDPTDRRDGDAWRLRERRSGLSGLGDRPVLHPAWRETDDAERTAPAASAAR